MEKLLQRIVAVFATNQAYIKNNVIYLRSANTLIAYQVELKHDHYYIYSGATIQDVCDTQEQVLEYFNHDRQRDEIKM